MNEPLTDIELFEYANGLIEDKQKLAEVEKRLHNSPACAERLKVEYGIDSLLKSELAVEEQVDVRQNVLDYFAKPAVKVVGVDVSWVILMVIFVSGLLIAGELSELNEKVPQLHYATLIASAVSALLIVDFFFKYLKLKKNSIS